MSDVSFVFGRFESEVAFIGSFNVIGRKRFLESSPGSKLTQQFLGVLI